MFNWITNPVTKLLGKLPIQWVGKLFWGRSALRVPDDISEDAEALAMREKILARVAAGGPMKFLPLSDNYTEETQEMRDTYPIMLREPAVKAALLTKILAVAQLEPQVQPADDKPINKEAAEFVQYCLANIKGGPRKIAKAVLFGGLINGYSVSEKVRVVEKRGKWKGKLRYSALKSKDTKRLDLEGDQFRNITGVLDKQTQTVYHPSNFVIYSHMNLFEAPTGISDLRAAFRSFWLIDTAWQLRAIALERYSLPFIKGTYTDPAHQPDLETALEKARSQSWIALPVGAQIEALQLATQSNDQFQNAITQLNEQIVLSITGAVLQMLQGQVADARGSSSVHKTTSELLQWELAAELADIIKDQLVPDLVDLNFEGADYPTVNLGGVNDADMVASLQIDVGLLNNLSLPLDREDVYKRYGRKKPLQLEDAILPAQMAQVVQQLTGGVPPGMPGGEELQKLVEMQQMQQAAQQGPGGPGEPGAPGIPGSGPPGVPPGSGPGLPPGQDGQPQAPAEGFDENPLEWPPKKTQEASQLSKIIRDNQAAVAAGKITSAHATTNLMHVLKMEREDAERLLATSLPPPDQPGGPAKMAEDDGVDKFAWQAFQTTRRTLGAKEGDKKLYGKAAMQALTKGISDRSIQYQSTIPDSSDLAAVKDRLYRSQRTDRPASRSLQLRKQVWEASLSNEEKYAIQSYPGGVLGSPSIIINNILRNPKKLSFVKDPQQRRRAFEVARHLQSAIAKAPPLMRDMIVFRGVPETVVEKFKPGETIHDKGFVSASLSSNIARSYAKKQRMESAHVHDPNAAAMFRIHLPKGMRVGVGNHDVLELILPSGTNFKVQRAKTMVVGGKRRTFIDVQALNPNIATAAEIPLGREINFDAFGDTDQPAKFSNDQVNILTAPARKDVEFAEAKKTGKTIAVDLDGTLAEYTGWKGEDDFGRARPGAREAIQKLHDQGHIIIIFTTRGRRDLVSHWLRDNGIVFDYINENPNQPEGTSGKVVADVYIDDRAVNAKGAWDGVLQNTLAQLLEPAAVYQQDADKRVQKHADELQPGLQAPVMGGVQAASIAAPTLSPLTTIAQPTVSPVSTMLPGIENTAASTQMAEDYSSHKETEATCKVSSSWNGINICIENPIGSRRSGVGKDGKPWSTVMQHHYGRIKRSESEADGDEVDIFLGPNPEAKKVFVVDQFDPTTGLFDEHKAMLGFKSAKEAVAAYHANYEPDWKGYGGVTEMDADEFSAWLAGDTRLPLSHLGKAQVADKGKRLAGTAKEDLPAPDVAGPQQDASKAQQLLDHVEKEGANILSQVAANAVTRLMATRNPLRARRLFTDEEREKIAGAIASARASGNLLGQSRTLLRVEEVLKHAETFSEDAPTNFQRFDEPKAGVPIHPQRALEYFQGLVPKLNVDPNRFGPAMQRDAFTMAAATDAEVLKRVKEVLRTAIATGQGIPQAPASIQKILSDAGIAPSNPQYSELVFRSNMMDAYTQGTVQAMQDPQVADLFPVWRYAGIRDGRQRPEHEAHFGKYFANATAFAEVRDSIKHSPWNCRCNPVPVSKFSWQRLRANGARISSIDASATPFSERRQRGRRVSKALRKMSESIAAVAKATQALAEREQLPIIVPPPVVNLPVPPEAPEFQIESIQRDDKGQIKTVVKKQVRKKLK